MVKPAKTVQSIAAYSVVMKDLLVNYDFKRRVRGGEMDVMCI